MTTLLLAAEDSNGTMEGLKGMVTDLSQTLGVDLFEEDIDNVVFQTNEFLCNSDFIGYHGPFWFILQMAMALGVLFSIIVAAGMSYKMMVKNEPIDVFKILKVLGIAIVMCFWYPPSMTGIGATSSNDSILDALAFIPNCIGSYTHDLYEAEAIQVNDKYKELMPLIHARDSIAGDITSNTKLAEEETKKSGSNEVIASTSGNEQAAQVAKDAEKAAAKSTFAGLIIGLDKVVMFFALVNPSIYNRLLLNIL